MFKKYESDIKYLGKPTGFLTVAIILIFLSFSYGLDKVRLLVNNLEEAKKTENLLTTKINILRNVQALIAHDTTFLNMALPEKNAAIYALNIIKTNVSKNAVYISDLRATSQVKTKEGYGRVNFSFDAMGPEQGIYDLINSFSTVLPVMSVDKVDITRDESGITAKISVNVFSADLPRKIPTLTTPITEFNNEELIVLSEITGYSLPSFTKPEPGFDQNRVDPFN